MSITRYYNRMAQVVFFLTRGPRTVKELGYLLGLGERDRSYVHSQVSRYLRALEEEGLVEQQGFRWDTGRGRRARVWVWVANAGSETNA